jgi:ESCRT-II complex subunit VPS22
LLLFQYPHTRLVQKKADELKAISLQSAIDTCEKLELKLTEFARLHQSEIQNDPVVRQRFLQMCAPLGVDPLQSKKTFWGQLLGMGDFYHELAVQVAEVCLASRSKNGGIMSVTQVQSILQKRKTRLGMAAASSDNKQVSAADIAVAISKLAQLGGGFRTVQVGASTMIVSVPEELDQDVVQVMSVAQTDGVTVDHICATTGWQRDRVERALQVLLQRGMAWLDINKGESYYWFPASWQEEREKGNVMED